MVDTSKKCYLFFDWDGTVCAYMRGVPKPVLDALGYARSLGHELILCTGRANGAFPEEFRKLFRWDAMIFGGADIFCDGKWLRRMVTPIEEILLWAEYAMRNRCPLRIGGQERLIFHDEYQNDPIPAEKIPEELERLKKGLEGTIVTKMSIVCANADPKGFPKKSGMNIVRHPTYIELFPHGCDKGDAIRYYCREKGASLSQCICFGDSVNDLSMFDACPTGVCMMSSSSVLTERSAFHARSAECGVAEGIYHFFGRPEGVEDLEAPEPVTNDLVFRSDLLTQTDRYSKSLRLPDYPRLSDGTIDRIRLRHTLLWEEYGYVDDAGVKISGKVTEVKEDQYAGKCRVTTVEITLQKGDRSGSFPIHIFQPYSKKKLPTILQINFHPELPNRYAPIEELMDERINLVHLCYRDVTSDDNDFSTGVAPLLTDRSDPHAAGKIAIWAYAARVTATWLLENGYAEERTLAVAGHSRLGKTALLVGALDIRFQAVLSNCSGCCGAAISREKTGETIADICRVFPFWFNTHFLTYVGRENEMPFDQHYLTAAIAPRNLCIVTAKEDDWADTDAQYLAAEATDAAYEAAGVTGLDRTDGLLPDGKSTTAGKIAFSKRSGTHFFSRDDWRFFIRFLKSKM